MQLLCIPPEIVPLMQGLSGDGMDYVGIRKTVVFDARVFHKVFITAGIAVGG